MTQHDHQFRVVMRGYDSTEVDRVITDLQSRLASAEQSAAALNDRLVKAETTAAETAEPAAPAPATYEHLGERIGQMLSLAEQEVAEMRERAIAEVETMHKDAEQSSLATREAADEYAEKRRHDAEAEGNQLLNDSRRAADEERDAAERDASAMRQEAEAIFEKQQANASQAAANFEQTLAERRDRTTAEFQEKQAAAQAELDAMAARIEDMRATAERERADADAEARRIVTDAEERAASVTQDARTAADRIRTESDRELAAAMQRRDSINAQLTNVRQMLATLTGSVPGVVAVDPNDVQDDAVEQVVLSDVAADREAIEDTAADDVAGEQQDDSEQAQQS